MKYPLSHHKTSALDWLCLRAIAFYQYQISPRKGWRCAYARLHGGAGCSGFAREAIAHCGVKEALPLVRARFDDCKKAGQTLRAQHGDASNESRQRRGRRDKGGSSKANWCDCTPLEFCDVRAWRCADSLIDCGPGDTGCCDVGDCNPCN